MYIGTSLVVQQLRLWASTAGGRGSIAGQGTKIPHAVQYGQNVKQNKTTYIKCKYAEKLKVIAFLKDIAHKQSPKESWCSYIIN